MHPNPPRTITVGLARALIVIGVSATVFPIDFVILPDFAGMTSEVIGVWSFLAAAVVLMAGIIFKGI